MNKWIKRSLIGISALVGLVVIVLGVLVALNWSSVRILMGTGEVVDSHTGTPQPIAAPQEAVAGEHDWPCWRGENNDGKSSVTGILTDWSQGLPKLWEVDYLCQGGAAAAWSAPVIRGNRLIVAGRRGEQDLLFALDPATGALIWSNGYDAPAQSNHGAGPRATPTIDGERVYTLGRSGDLVCWSIQDGQIVWHANVAEQGGEEPGWGHSCSPFILGEKVIVQAGGQARTIAYDKATGEVVWRSGQGIAGYASFALITAEPRQQLVVFYGKGLAGLDPKDGSVLWDLPWETPYDVNATTPIVLGNEVVITSGYGRGAQLVRLAGTTPQVVWTSDALSAQHSDPFVIDGYLYGYSGDSSQNKGSFVCLDWATGELQWSSDEIGWGTCRWVDGYLLCLDIRGNLALVAPSPTELVLVTRLPNALGKTRGPVWTVPVVANGMLYLRFKQQLVCYLLVPPVGS